MINRFILPIQRLTQWVAFTGLLILVPIAGLSQSYSKERILAQRRQNLEQIMAEQGLMNIPLTYGKLYQYRYPGTDGNQFLNALPNHDCSLTYDGLSFHPITLRYDLVNHLVITPRIQGSNSEFLILNQPRITAFRIGDKEFVRWPDGHNPGLFYQLAFNGKRVTLLVGLNKTLNKPLYQEPGEKDKFFLHADYFLRINGHFSKVSSRKDLFRVLEDGSLKAFARKKGIRLRFNQTQTIDEIVELLKYFESLD